MNQPLNYEINGVRYYYELDVSKWYTLDKNNQVKYVNTRYDNQYDIMSYVYDTMTLCLISMTLCHTTNKLTLIENRQVIRLTIDNISVKSQ